MPVTTGSESLLHPVTWGACAATPTLAPGTTYAQTLQGLQHVAELPVQHRGPERAARANLPSTPAVPDTRTTFLTWPL